MGLGNARMGLRENYGAVSVPCPQQNTLTGRESEKEASQSSSPISAQHGQPRPLYMKVIKASGLKDLASYQQEIFAALFVHFSV